MAGKSYWKQIERLVAELVGGARSWETDFDVIALVDYPDTVDPSILSGPELLGLTRAGIARGYAVEVKNRQSITIAECERWLAYNQAKINQSKGNLGNALVVKRRAGVGIRTPLLLIVPLEEV